MSRRGGRKLGLLSEDIARRNDAIFLMWVRGAAFAEIAPAFDLTAAMIGIIVRRRGGRPRQPERRGVIQAAPQEDKYAKRDAEMVGMYRMGHTLQEIGDYYGVTREAVRLRLSRHNIDGMDGGATARTLKRTSDRIAKKAAKAAKAAERHFRKWGMAQEAVDALSPFKRSDPRHPLWKYSQQRNSAKQRAIPWRLTFAEWWRIWQESGHWDERGRGKGYCMARWADDGPYSVDNVYICTIGQNFSDAWLVRPRNPNAKRRVGPRKKYWAIGTRYCVQLPFGRRAFVPDEAAAVKTLASHGVQI